MKSPKIVIGCDHPNLQSQEESGIGRIHIALNEIITVEVYTT